LISDSKRAAYDASGGQSSYEFYQNQHQAQQQQQAGYAQTAADAARDTFNGVQEDVTVIKEALELYLTDIKEELHYAVDCVQHRDWNGLWELAKAHKGIIFGIVVPTALILRFPALILLAGRFGYAGLAFLVTALIRSGHIATVVHRLWRGIVQIAKARRQRRGE